MGENRESESGNAEVGGASKRWQAERDTALGDVLQTGASGDAKAPSPLRFAGAVQKSAPLNLSLSNLGRWSGAGVG
jgi:hypothetical protein